MLNKDSQAEAKVDSEQMPIADSSAQMPQNPMLGAVSVIDESQILNEDYYNENLALAYLLVNDICFLNNVDLSKQMPQYYKEPTCTTCVYVNCNDTFYYASADAECVSNSDGDADSEIIALYKMVKESPKYGYAKFCALKRKMRPLNEIVKWMKDDNYWDEQLEALPER